MGFIEKYNTTKEQLEQWYVIEKRSYRWLMEKLGIDSARTVKRLFCEAQISVRKGSEAVAAQWINNPERRKAWGDMNRRLRLGKKFGPLSEETKKKIGDANRGENNGMHGSGGPSHKWYQHNKSGPLSPTWLGGKDNWKSKRVMASKKKKEIIKKLGSLCVRCGTTENLTINHKIPWRECRHHEMWNLEVLCKKCHFSGPVRLR